MAAKRGKVSTEEEAALKEKSRLLKKVQKVPANLPFCDLQQTVSDNASLAAANAARTEFCG